LIRALGDEALGVRVAAARALGELGDPSAVVPLYEVASDETAERWLRQVARNSLEQLGFERHDGGGPPAILAWVAGVGVIAASLLLATAIGPVAIVGLFAGAAIIVAYYARETRKSRDGGWYTSPDGDDYWIPGPAGGGDSGGWLGDFFGGGGDGGGGGNGGGA
jgi:hypothetical protein